MRERVGKWWHALPDGRLQCDLCPRNCRLRDGQRGYCFVRERNGDHIALTTYGYSSGFAIDPIEKKPLYHFYPNSAVLSFGTAGCNLGCKFCQNWDISAAKDRHRLGVEASPEQIAQVALENRLPAIAFTYNDPVIFAEYAIDTANVARQQGINPVAVTAGYISAAPRKEFFAPMAATNIDLKAMDEDFYWRVTGGHLRDVLDTIAYVHHETDTWLEITNLVIPGHNDNPAQIEALVNWLANELGPDVPLHFSAFHPDFKMLNVPRTPPETLTKARQIALAAGLHFVYTGNVIDPAGSATYCPNCQTELVERMSYQITANRLTSTGQCPNCHQNIPGRF
ncbi:MAG: AmmeMemoRadiSam system radical SAM enzyme [Cellulomonadaceae bacterium]|jgi:pyruvate formate lyase activating enzyme|nr:AmmeMemoRadiSam system radical SAM enzyme [Cellulomonadaceae bacterium]